MNHLQFCLRRTLTPLFAAVCGVALSSAAAAIDAVVPDDFATISSAVGNATDVDSNGTIEILVRAGLYNENVQFVRSNLTLKGEDRATTVVQGIGGNDTLRASFSSNVLIEQLTIVGVAEGLSRAAIDFNGMSDSTIREVTTIGGDSGIQISASSIRCTVNSADVSGAALEGIKVDQSSFVNLAFNLVHDNLQDGIQVDASDNVRVVRNAADDNGSAGVRERLSQDNTFLLNIATGNDTGFDSEASSGSRYFLNEATQSASSGISIEDSISVWLVRNTSTANLENGLRMRGTTDTRVFRNALTDNFEWGVRREDWLNDDFDAGVPGVQDPPGGNNISGNRFGAVRED